MNTRAKTGFLWYMLLLLLVLALLAAVIFRIHLVQIRQEEEATRLLTVMDVDELYALWQDTLNGAYTLIQQDESALYWDIEGEDSDGYSISVLLYDNMRGELSVSDAVHDMFYSIPFTYTERRPDGLPLIVREALDARGLSMTDVAQVRRDSTIYYKMSLSNYNEKQQEEISNCIVLDGSAWQTQKRLLCRGYSILAVRSYEGLYLVYIPPIFSVIFLFALFLACRQVVLRCRAKKCE